MIRRSERDAEEWDKPLSHISRPLVPAAEHAERLLVGGSAAARLGWADGAGRLLQCAAALLVTPAARRALSCRTRRQGTAASSAGRSHCRGTIGTPPP